MGKSFAKGKRIKSYAELLLLGKDAYVFLFGILLPVSSVRWSLRDFKESEVYQAVEE